MRRWGITPLFLSTLESKFYLINHTGNTLGDSSVKSKSLLVIVIIGVLLVGAYFIGIPLNNMRNVLFECQEVYDYSETSEQFSVYFQFLNTGNSDVILSDMEMKIYFKPPENKRILVGSKDFTSILQLNGGILEERYAYVDMHSGELQSYLESIGFDYNTESGRKFLLDSKFIIEVSATGRNLSWSTQVRYSDSIPYFDIK